MIFKTQKMEFIKKAPIAKKQADKVQWDVLLPSEMTQF